MELKIGLAVLLLGLFICVALANEDEVVMSDALAFPTEDDVQNDPP